MLLLGITSSTALTTFKCNQNHLGTYCFVKNEIYHDENEAIIFNTDDYTITDHDFTAFDTTNGSNNFSVFPNAIFEKFPYLSLVHVIDAQLKTLNKKSFTNCLGLHDLSLSRNLIEHLEAGIFEQCENLVVLNVQMNKISSIDKDAFRNLWSLETLYLSDNSITSLDQDTFNYLPNLIRMIVDKHQITRLHNDTFMQQKIINLSDNKSLSMESNTFRTFKCSPWRMETYCTVENETYHDENEAILFDTDSYTNTDQFVTTFDTVNGVNNFSVFPSAIFKKFPLLNLVHLIGAQLKTLNKKSFSNCLSLHELSLAINLIEHLDAGVFEKCGNLVVLNIQMNKISIIDKDAFRNLWSLKVLYLFDNSITTLHSDTFIYQLSLNRLGLNNNQITKLHNDTFKQQKHMYSLDLSYNKMLTIESDLFEDLSSLTEIKLGHNHINAIQPNFFENWPPNGSIADITLEYNFCVKKDFLRIGSQNMSVESVRPEFAQCFKNYMRPKLTPNV